MATARIPLIDRFMRHVSPEPNTGCWLWTGSIVAPNGYNKNGYGMFFFDGKPRKAHRIAYQIFVGQIPEGLQMDHLCRVRCCVNPAHLEPVTLQENVRRGDAGVNMSSRDNCPMGHEYTPENTGKQIALGVIRGRYCRACSRKRALEHKWLNR